MKQESPQHWVCLGRILRPHGIKGALFVKLDNPEGKTLRAGIQVQIKKADRIVGNFEVDAFQAGRLLQLKDLTDRTSAEKLAGSVLFVARDDFPELNPDEIYLGDMLHFEVFSEEGENLGKVCGFSDNTAQIILEVRSNLGKVGLIPFVKPLIIEVEQHARKIVVDLPPGLFENTGSDD